MPSIFVQINIVFLKTYNTSLISTRLLFIIRYRISNIEMKRYVLIIMNDFWGDCSGRPRKTHDTFNYIIIGLTKVNKEREGGNSNHQKRRLTGRFEVWGGFQGFSVFFPEIKTIYICCWRNDDWFYWMPGTGYRLFRSVKQSQHDPVSKVQSFHQEISEKRHLLKEEAFTSPDSWIFSPGINADGRGSETK